MEKQKQTKDEKVEKKDILEEVKELDRKVRARIVYDKLGDIKSWAREIAELKQKTQLLLDKLGVEDVDIKRLIDYATNSPEAQLSKEDIADLKEEVDEMITESKKKIHKKIAESPLNAAYVMHAGATNTATTSNANGMSYTTSGTSDDSTTWVSKTADNIDFEVK